MLQIYAALTCLYIVLRVEGNGIKYSAEIPPVINYSPIDTTFIDENATEIISPGLESTTTATKRIAVGSSIQVSNAINPVTTFLNDTDNLKSEGKRSSFPVQEISIPFNTTETPAKSPTEKLNKSVEIDEKFKPSPQLQDFFENNSFKVTSFPPRHENLYTKTFAKNHFTPPLKYNFELPVLSKGKNPFKLSEEGPKFSKPQFYVDDLQEINKNQSAYSILPAGGLYQIPKYDLPKESTVKISDHNSRDKHIKWSSVKPRQPHSSPMADFMGLLTAILPVGLIISALTPNIINVETTRRAKREYPVESLQPYNYQQIVLN